MPHFSFTLRTALCATSSRSVMDLDFLQSQNSCTSLKLLNTSSFSLQAIYKIQFEPHFVGFVMSQLISEMSHVMRLWIFLSSVNSFFKCACAANQWDQMSGFWLDPSSTSILHVCEQRRFWRDFANALARLSLR